MCRKRFTVIGISDSHNQFFPPDILEVIRDSKIFSGGKRHREIVAQHLPAGYEWIDVTVPLSAVFDRYNKHDDITVFASGDPLFYGYATTLMREFPDAEIKVYPTFNSLQMLCHRMSLPYQDMINVSLTGRPWKNLDDKLIEGHSLIGVLTDKVKSPDEIAKRMLDYGYDNYMMSVGAALGNDTDEKVMTMTLNEAVRTTFGNPNCVILQMTRQRHRYFGIPESEFHHLEGRSNMITKMPIRLLSLSMLDLYDRKNLWDIGFCTGSVSIEARLQFPHLDITSFERREESRELMEKNCRKFGAPSIRSVIGDFLEADLSAYPRPDAVFIGGHGGKLDEIIDRLSEVMADNCIIVFNSVSTQSCDTFKKSISNHDYKIVDEHFFALDSFNPITILKALCVQS
ncbi:MAG: precorrin-6y C5,15-methyltransferase (decarboxylating) subunit CbiE [Bacteroides sp.]|nr:precorrin-6y C5,15-methyltransferase (decarboxylating) subunit CbiE [Bacteroides sp.]